MNNSWRRYNIFISSTFKDMDFERDIIKFRVIPALNRRFRDRRVELQAIDLRLGVNTAKMSEEESERKVLSVCTSCIDSARPFFVGLLGQRYGWIPPLERWNEFMAGLSDDEHEMLKDTAGRSVTEMEIVYGALSQRSFDTSHVLFYLRDDASYDGMPEDLKPVFCDTDSENLRRLDCLKDKVRTLFGERSGDDDRCTPYRLQWKEDHFDSDEFETLVTEQLAARIEMEVAREEEEGSDSWWAQEKELEESSIMRLLSGTMQFEIYDDEDGDANDDSSDDMAILYCPGFGASTRMAQEYESREDDEDVLRLLAVFGLSEYSCSMRPVIVRWIYELASAIGRTELPDDDMMLESMPLPELYELFESLVKEVAEEKYIYIYLDDVEALETRSSKDLYMPWLDRVKDYVNIMVNLQLESEAGKKFLKAHSYLNRKILLGVQNDAEAAEELIAGYEGSYFLELPDTIRKQMNEAALSSKQILVPLKLHNVFRLFESLTSEDFKLIRSCEGSQIDAINGYLENIWEEMPDAPYELMTFMVNHIATNLGLGNGMLDALWVLASAPAGLREMDIAHFAGEDWDEVQFYRAMNFLYDFFYEDRSRHLWRAKYITCPQDGLAARQKQISEYILTLDKDDSLRETMGLYYALGACEPTHFRAYLLEGDYIHLAKISAQIKCYGPQIRQLMREGYLDSSDFEKYCKALPCTERLQLMMNVLTALGDLKEERENIHFCMAAWLEDVQLEDLSAPDAFALASILAGRPKSIPYMEKALAAVRYCQSLGYGNSAELFSAISSLLIYLYQKKGQKNRADELLRESMRGSQSPKERLEALNTLVARAAAPSLLGARNKRRSALDQFFEEYYAIVNELDDSEESFRIRAGSVVIVKNAFALMLRNKDYERLMAETVRFIPSMELFYCARGFFDQADSLQLYLIFHLMVSKAADALGEKFQRIADIAFLALCEGGNRLKEVNPDDEWIERLRGHCSDMLDKADAFRSELGLEGVGLEDLDSIIKQEYDKTQN